MFGIYNVCRLYLRADEVNFGVSVSKHLYIFVCMYECVCVYYLPHFKHLSYRLICFFALYLYLKYTLEYIYVVLLIFVCVCVCVSTVQSAAGLSRDSRPSPFGKSSELIVTNLWVGPRPLTHNTPGQRGHNPSTYILYLLTAR